MMFLVLCIRTFIWWLCLATKFSFANAGYVNQFFGVPADICSIYIYRCDPVFWGSSRYLHSVLIALYFHRFQLCFRSLGIKPMFIFCQIPLWSVDQFSLIVVFVYLDNNLVIFVFQILSCQFQIYDPICGKDVDICSVNISESV